MKVVGYTDKYQILVLQNAKNTLHFIEVWDVKNDCKVAELQHMNIVFNVDDEQNLQINIEESLIKSAMNAMSYVGEYWPLNESVEVNWVLQQNEEEYADVC